jgi:ketosteroid isomerase-like protein
LRFYKDVFVEAFEENVIEPERFLESGDSVVVPNTGRVRGRDGIHAVVRSALLFEVRDGWIVRIRLYQETGEALEAVGLSD